MSDYTVGDHLGMISDAPRFEAFREALRRVVEPGDVVVDIGTGTGVFAVLAARFGAGRVYAIEPDPVIEVARQIARDNGVADRIEFVRAMSTDAVLPERATVVVGDIGGVLPTYRGALAAWIDARRRLLAPGGCTVPASQTLSVALVEIPRPHHHDPEALAGRSREIDLTAAVRFVRSELRSRRVEPGQLLSEPRRWASIDLSRLESAAVRGEAELGVAREGTANCLAVWFDAELTAGVGFSNAPGQRVASYRQELFPLCEGVRVAPGDRVAVSFEGILVGEEYAWRWRTRIEDRDGGERARFDQSSIQATPVSIDSLRRREAGYRPAPGEEGAIDRFILECFDGEMSLGEISSLLRDRFPERFGGTGGAAAALSRVAAISERYG